MAQGQQERYRRCQSRGGSWGLDLVPEFRGCCRGRGEEEGVCGERERVLGRVAVGWDRYVALSDLGCFDRVIMLIVLCDGKISIGSTPLANESTVVSQVSTILQLLTSRTILTGSYRRHPKLCPPHERTPRRHWHGQGNFDRHFR